MSLPRRNVLTGWMSFLKGVSWPFEDSFIPNQPVLPTPSAFLRFLQANRPRAVAAMPIRPARAPGSGIVDDGIHAIPEKLASAPPGRDKAPIS